MNLPNDYESCGECGFDHSYEYEEAARHHKVRHHKGGKMDKHDVERFLRAYIECALWSTNDESDESGGEPFDRNYGPEDLHEETLKGMREDCERFLAENWEDIKTKLDSAGHDFWLTRNGHGAGFWDGDWPEDVGERLTEASRNWGEVYLYLGDDGKIHQN